VSDPTSDTALLAVAHAMAYLDHPIKTEIADWARQELATGDRVGADLRSEFAADDWKRCADRGIHGVMVPTELGGSGADLATTLLTLEGLGHGCRDNGLAFAIGSQILSTQETIVRFGSEEQQREWIPPLIAGDVLGAFAMTEPDSGSDAYSLTTTAVRREDGTYVLNGHKAYLTLGSRCAFVIVFASTKPGAGAWGLSTFLVPTDLDGVERLANRDKMGMRTTPFGDITLTDVVVPASALIGREGSGAAIFNAVLQVERSFVFATQVGAMQRQLEAGIAYACEREQGGQPIGSYQAVAHRIADMKQRHETARLMLYRAALASATGRDMAMSAALAKLTASEAGLDAALSASMVHGAKGYVSEFEVERDLRDAIGGLVYSGTSDIQRNIIARLLGLG
jgi:alkylation response protein AidB-like acyl-CoA dehydrogenase